MELTDPATAILIALLHLMFLYLRHKPANDDGSIPQAYVSTASNLFVTAYGQTLNAALTIAFTQHLWRIFRTSTLKISTVEALYTVISNPLAFFTGEGVRRAPLLLLLALLIWTIGIATSFPPGGLTVGTIEIQSYENIKVPTFNPYYVGNGTYAELQEVSVPEIHYAGPVNDTQGFWLVMETSFSHRGPLLRLATSTMVGEQMMLARSPCGLNCSYGLEFEGPVFSCVESATNMTYNETDNDIFPLYKGVWQNTAYYAPLG